MQKIAALLLLLVSSTMALVISDSSTTDTARTESILYPLIMNPWQISHWNCFGITLYENTAATGYTYSADVCLSGLIAAKLLFPWFYQLHTGQSLLAALNLPHFSPLGRDGYEEQAEYLASEEYQPEYPNSYEEPQATYETHERRAEVSFQERLSSAFKDLSRAIKRDPRPHRQPVYSKQQQ